MRGRGGVEGNARRVCTPPKVVPKARIRRSGGCRGTGVISGTRGWEGSGEGGMEYRPTWPARVRVPLHTNPTSPGGL